jgi:sirohydrochlorin ferrochelatase
MPCTVRKNDDKGNRAVILIGHGSRAAGADDDMERVAYRLQEDGEPIVEVCRMGRGTPFAEVLERCIRKGAKTVLVIPYFLHFGVHLRQDIPEILRMAVAGHPEVRLVLGLHLGYDEALVALVEKRIEESMDLCDIRETDEVPIDRHPGEVPAQKTGRS